MHTIMSATNHRVIIEGFPEFIPIFLGDSERLSSDFLSTKFPEYRITYTKQVTYRVLILTNGKVKALPGSAKKIVS